MNIQNGSSSEVQLFDLKKQPLRSKRINWVDGSLTSWLFFTLSQYLRSVLVKSPKFVMNSIW